MDRRVGIVTGKDAVPKDSTSELEGRGRGQGAILADETCAPSACPLSL
jgi:hypothetical protein